MMSTDDPKPSVLIIRITPPPSTYEEVPPPTDDEPYYQQLLDELTLRVSVMTVSSPSDAIKSLQMKQPSIVISTTETLAVEENFPVLQEVLDRVREGTSAIIMGMYPEYAESADMKVLFSQAGLSWNTTNVVGATLTVNQAATGSKLAAALPARYTTRALLLNNVAFSDAWYTADCTSHPYAVDPSEARPLGESAVALGHVADGKLGYVGDVYALSESVAIILAMCGLPSGKQLTGLEQLQSLRL
ncbi:hypothetical protein N7478_005743 [Penicillium angulare]|uniref:uncharacterized protein n=1 Tax=Penicillium angulare TaxID=116970 RepID=UPI00254038EC|nr:uncharacterized protein N7478_005743 [Penicillium angulare]KAJ5280371.1 hypothetical protein N7478_005743 [Penicillium angulare]